MKRTKDYHWTNLTPTIGIGGEYFIGPVEVHEWRREPLRVRFTRPEDGAENSFELMLTAEEARFISWALSEAADVIEGTRAARNR